MANQFALRYVKLVPEQTSSAATLTDANQIYGTASDMTDYDAVAGQPDYIGGEVDDESITHQFEVLYRSDMSRFGQAKSQQGKEYSEGGINFAMQADMFMGCHWYGVYGGTGSSVPAVSSGTHTFTEGNTHRLPSFTMKVGRDEKEHTYTGMCINRLGISASLNEYIMVSADYVGKAESAVGAIDNATVFCGRAVDGMHFADAQVKFNNDSTASTLVKSITCDWNMNLDTDMACTLGNTTYVRKPMNGLREITGSVEFAKVVHTAVESEPTYTQMITEGGLEVNNSGATDPALGITLTDGTSPTYIELYKVRWEAPSANVSGRDSQTMSLNFTALYGVNQSAMSKVIFNDTGSAAIPFGGL